MTRDQEIEFLQKVAKSLFDAANEIQSVFAEFEKHEISLESDYDYSTLWAIVEDLRSESDDIDGLIDDLKTLDEEE